MGVGWVDRCGVDVHVRPRRGDGREAAEEPKPGYGMNLVVFLALLWITAAAASSVGHDLADRAGA